jgi:hypothetical protein
MEPIKDIIGTLIKDLQDKRRKPPGVSPTGLLKKVFSNKELKHLQFSSIKKGNLNIKVDSSTWLYYLNLKKKSLLIKFAEKLPEIRNIHFSIGDIKTDKKETNNKFNFCKRAL